MRDVIMIMMFWKGIEQEMKRETGRQQDRRSYEERKYKYTQTVARGKQQ